MQPRMIGTPPMPLPGHLIHVPLAPPPTGISDANLVATNPGAGAGCEGEDVKQITQLGPFDALTAHLYWRCEGARCIWGCESACGCPCVLVPAPQ
jgi:hypothetical protein